VEECSSRCSRTKRTARSRTSGENLLDFLFMALFSQELEPPQNPGRFKNLFHPYFKFTEQDLVYR
ncbi:hypothetical protein, partial [Herbaspirillum huttiense]|uniref:hypothetical protein n=1 Tax=Herbaspirillum huttiense TaxID=863372 RepID=UPI003F3608DB